MTVKSNLLGYFFYFAFIFTLTLPEGLVCCPCSCPCALFRRLRKVYHVFLSFLFFFITLHHANMVVYFPLGPRLETGGMPDLNYCRLYQKLQVSHTR